MTAMCNDKVMAWQTSVPFPPIPSTPPLSPRNPDQEVPSSPPATFSSNHPSENASSSHQTPSYKAVSEPPATDELEVNTNYILEVNPFCHSLWS